MNYNEHATTLQTAIRAFLTMALLAPARRSQSAQELRQMLHEAAQARVAREGKLFWVA